jgi:hypothetical protein
MLSSLAHLYPDEMVFIFTCMQKPVRTMKKVEQHHLQIIAWSVCIALLAFMCLVHTGMEISFLSGSSLIERIAPVSFVIAIMTGYLFAAKNGLAGVTVFAPAVVTVVFCVVSVFLSALFFDLSWDGQWYHQTAVYKIADGWNPLADPMKTFNGHNDTWIRHYAKSSWYISAALFKTFQHIEWAKAITWITLAVAFLSVFVVLLEYGFSRLTSAALALVVAINPVTTLQRYMRNSII